MSIAFCDNGVWFFSWWNNKILWMYFSFRKMREMCPDSIQIYTILKESWKFMLNQWNFIIIILLNMCMNQSRSYPVLLGGANFLTKFNVFFSNFALLDAFSRAYTQHLLCVWCLTWRVCVKARHTIQFLENYVQNVHVQTYAQTCVHINCAYVYIVHTTQYTYLTWPPVPFFPVQYRILTQCTVYQRKVRKYTVFRNVYRILKFREKNSDLLGFLTENHVFKYIF